ncbi:MAG: phosphatidate cytidylyltransferase [Alphaproteobacteria bacterium]|nr:phosphatidate cytidylyltransferase [Alphaproteobacteria bacterium]
MAKNNLFYRIITALILAPLVIGCIFLDFPYYHLLILTIGGFLSWEWSNLVAAKEKQALYSTIYTLSMATSVMLQSWLGIIIMIVMSSGLIFLKAGQEKHRLLVVLGVPYISIGVGSLMWLYYMTEFPHLMVLWLLIVVWSVDIGGYLVGTTFKGPKLAKKISPNKTWSGLIGGMIFAAFFGGFFAYIFQEYNHYYYAAFAAALAIVEQIGDLIESAIKRKVGAKDSSSIIPGHGGVFDRVDGLIFTAPVLLISVITYYTYIY